MRCLTKLKVFVLCLYLALHDVEISSLHAVPFKFPEQLIIDVALNGLPVLLKIEILVYKRETEPFRPQEAVYSCAIFAL